MLASFSLFVTRHGFTEMVLKEVRKEGTRGVEGGIGETNKNVGREGGAG